MATEAQKSVLRKALVAPQHRLRARDLWRGSRASGRALDCVRCGSVAVAMAMPVDAMVAAGAKNWITGLRKALVAPQHILHAGNLWRGSRAVGRALGCIHCGSTAVAMAIPVDAMVARAKT